MRIPPSHVWITGNLFVIHGQNALGRMNPLPFVTLMSLTSLVSNFHSVPYHWETNKGAADHQRQVILYNNQKKLHFYDIALLFSAQFISSTYITYSSCIVLWLNDLAKQFAVSQKEYEDAVKLMTTVDPIKNRELPPPDKYEEPLTVAQEYGWFKGPLVCVFEHFSSSFSNVPEWSVSFCWVWSDIQNLFLSRGLLFGMEFGSCQVMAQI